MEKPQTDLCCTCYYFTDGRCLLHKIDVCHNDEGCKDFREKQQMKQAAERIRRQCGYVARVTNQNKDEL